MSVQLDIEQVKAILTVSDLVTSWHVLLADETMDRAVYRIRCQLLRPAYRLESRLIQTAEDLLYAYHIGKYLSSVRKLDDIVAPKEGFEAQL